MPWDARVPRFEIRPALGEDNDEGGKYGYKNEERGCSQAPAPATIQYWCRPKPSWTIGQLNPGPMMAAVCASCQRPRQR